MEDQEYYIDRWVEEVYEKGEEVDPDDEYDWTGVAIGFFIGCGLEPEEAKEIYRIIYNRNLI